jgi:predicted transglutaminase-like cysteine proteinase
MTFKRIAWGAVVVLLGVGHAAAEDLGIAAISGAPSFLTIGDRTTRPIGHAEFCRINPEECRPTVEVVEEIALTDDLLAALNRVNRTLNDAIDAITDAELYEVGEYWTYPDDGAGDCEDFALAKRRALADEGWPLSTLLLAVVRQSSGAGHAVLAVRTHMGDLILDNLDDDIHTWSETPYTYVKRQDASDSAAWVSVLDRRDISTIVHQTSSLPPLQSRRSMQ